MRGRYGPDGQLYVVGLQGWQTSAAKEGGFHRVRRTDKPLGLPTALRTCDKGVYLTFAEPLDPETAADPESYGVQIWGYLYSPNYGDALGRRHAGVPRDRRHADVPPDEGHVGRRQQGWPQPARRTAQLDPPVGEGPRLRPVIGDGEPRCTRRS
jgi:hypothetical protein